jgi:hypothetical protein
MDYFNPIREMQDSPRGGRENFSNFDFIPFDISPLFGWSGANEVSPATTSILIKIFVTFYQRARRLTLVKIREFLKDFQS